MFRIRIRTGFVFNGLLDPDIVQFLKKTFKNVNIYVPYVCIRRYGRYRVPFGSSRSILTIQQCNKKIKKNSKRFKIKAGFLFQNLLGRIWSHVKLIGVLVISVYIRRRQLPSVRRLFSSHAAETGGRLRHNQVSGPT